MNTEIEAKWLDIDTSALGHEDSAKDKTDVGAGSIEYPQPEVFRKKRVPQELMSGNHGVIAAWRTKHTKRVAL